MAEQMTFDIVAKDSASAKLAEIGRNVDKLGDKLDALGRREVKPRITLDAERATTKLQEFNRALAEIRNVRARVDVDVNGRTEVGDLRRELAYVTDRKVKIRVDTADSNQKLKTITDRLALIRDTKVKVDVAVTGDKKLDDLAEKLRRIGVFSPVKVEIKLEGGQGALTEIRSVLDWLIILDGYTARPRIDMNGAEDALRNLRAIRDLMSRINGSSATGEVTIRSNWDRSIEGRLSGLIGSLLKIPAAAAAASGGLGVLGAAVASLVGGLAEAGGAALILPGALAAVGATAGTVALGLQGLDDAFKALADGDAEKLAEAMKALSGSGRELVTEVQRLGPAWQGLQLDVQQRLLAGLGAEVQQLGTAYFPSLRSGMTGIAMELNSATRGVTDFLQTGEAVSRVDSIFRSTRLAVQDIAPAADDVTAAFLDIAEVGASMLPELTRGAEGAAQSFRAFIAEARESGQLQVWIQTGIDRLQQLGQIAGNVGGILGGLFAAANAEGVDFITRLQEATQGVETFVRSAEGQNTLRAFFEESRQTVDALVPALKSLATAVGDSVRGFNDTDGMVRFGTAVSDVAETLSPLISRLGELAGGTLGVLSTSLSNAADLLSPLISGLGGLLDVLGPVGPAVLGMIAAFAGMRLVAGYITAVSTSMAAGALQAGVYAESMLLASGASAAFAASAGTRVATATSAMATGIGAAAKALPLLAVGFVAISAASDAFATHTDENVQQVIAGHMSMGAAIQKAADQIDANGIDWLGGADAQQALAMATEEANAEFKAQYDALSPMEKLQADVAIATKKLNDALAAGDMGAAATAAEELRGAQDRLNGVQEQAANLTKDHADAIQELGDKMREQSGAHLTYEQALIRTRDAQREATAALKAGGADSEAYRTEVLDLATAFLAQADAAKATAEAQGGAAAGSAAYVAEILRLNDGSRVGRDALIKLAEGMTQADLSTLSAAAAATGLRTEIINLPNGKTVEVVVGGDTSKIPTIQGQLEALTAKEYVGTVKLNGDPTVFQDTIRQSVELANGTTATMTLAGDGTPLTVEIEGQKYLVDNTTGVMTIDGNPEPGKANLTGLRVEVDNTTGVMTITGETSPARQALAGVLQQVEASIGTFTIDGNPTMANGKTTQAVRFADGSTGTITVDGRPDPATGKVNAVVTYANGRTATIQVDAGVGRAESQINAFYQKWNGRTINMSVGTTVKPMSASAPVGAGGMLVGQFAGGGLVAPNRPVAFAGGGVVKLGEVSDAEWKRLRSEGWKGRAGDRMEALYAPGAPASAASSTTPTTALSFSIGFGGGGHVIPGYAPGVDNVPGRIRGGPPVLLSPGEAVLVPELVRQLGPGNILRANAQASGGRPASIVGRFPGAFAGGGLAAAARPTPTPAVVAPTAVDPAYAEALDAAAEAGTALNEVQQLVADTATALGEQTALTTEQVTALTTAAQEATTADQAYQVGLTALQLANDTVTLAAQTRTAAEQVATEATNVALGQANAYTGGLTALGSQAAGGTTSGINTLTGAVQTETGTEATAQGQAQAYTDGLAALGGQAGGATTGGINTLTGAVNAAGGASVTATGQAQGHTTALGALGAQGGTTAGGLGQTTAAAQTLGGAHAAAGAQAQGQSGDLQALAGSAGQAAGELQGVATAINNLPDGEFVVTANGRMGAITGSPTVAKADGGVLPGYTPGRDVHSFVGPAGRLELSGGEAVMRPEWTKAVGPNYVHAANAAARAGKLSQFLRRTAPREGQNTQGDGSMLATGGIWSGPGRVQRYALGGVIGQQGNPFPPMPNDLWDDLSNRMADAMTPVMQQAVKDAELEAMGGDALAWARTQVGKPYQWGGVGPGGYDCSGFMSAILNVMNGKPPHSRVGSTASFPWGGFQPGIGGRFSIGAFKGNPGHMAGTLAGTNVESSGSVGVRVGGGARGAGDGMFSIRAHVANGGILPKFDQGGLASGTGLMLKDIIRPERVLDAKTTEAFDRLATVLPQAMAAQPGRVQLGRPGPVVAAGGGGAGQWVSAVQAEVSRQISAIQSIAADLAQRPSVTVNDVSGNPVETGRQTVLAYRMAR